MLSLNSVNAAGESTNDGTNYNNLDTAGKIQYQSCLASFYMDYQINYTIIGGQTKLFYPNNTGFISESVGVDFAKKYYTDLTNQFTLKIIKNEGHGDVFDIIGGEIPLTNAENGNGQELVIKANDNIIITVINFTLHNCTLDECTFYSNALNEGTKTYSEQSSKHNYQVNYKLGDECNEIRLKNVSSDNIILSDIIIDTTVVTRTVNSFSFKKNSKNRNVNALQFVGRIPSELYAEIGTTYNPSNVTFGLFYNNVGSMSSGDAKSVINGLKTGVFKADAYFINEVSYSSLNGYDETGFNIVQSNPTYYQWGISFTGISMNNVIPVINVYPYVKIKCSDTEYEVYALNPKMHSVKSICQKYLNDNVGTYLDKLAFDYISKYSD